MNGTNHRYHGQALQSEHQRLYTNTMTNIFNIQYRVQQKKYKLRPTDKLAKRTIAFTTQITNQPDWNIKTQTQSEGQTCQTYNTMYNSTQTNPTSDWPALSPKRKRKKNVKDELLRQENSSQHCKKPVPKSHQNTYQYQWQDYPHEN